MRSRFIPLVGVAFIVACADGATAPLLQPGQPSYDNPPPPWALIEGEVTTDGALLGLSFSRSADGPAVMSHAGSNTATYRAWLLVTPRDHAAFLRFTNDGTAKFSNGAMISKVNGKVSGRGTMTVSGHTYELSAVTQFDANGDCGTAPWDYEGPSCASFSADDGSFSSTGSVWTGILSNTGKGGKGPPPDDGCGEFECVCVNCVTITDSNGKRR